MSKSSYPTKILVWAQGRNGDINLQPDYSIVFYTERETDRFISRLEENKTPFRIEEHKPKLKELTRLSFFQKLAYLTPFKPQLADILVDILKFIIGFALGILTKQLML